MVGMQSLSLRFAESVRVLSGAARGQGLVVPAFRSPPHSPSNDRTIRRRGSDVTVAVRLNGRPFAAVQSDLIQGLLVVNEIEVAHADEVRRTLWNALAAAGLAEPGSVLAAA